MDISYSWRSSSFIICALLVSTTLSAITFDDLKTSYAQFHRWQPLISSQGIEGKFSLLFKTHLRDSILLYQDDGHRDYISVELLNAKVLVNFGISGESARIQIGHDLADMMWHKIIIQLKNDSIRITLDQNFTQTATIQGPNQALLGSSGYLYIGGLPGSLSISSLSSPQVVFKKRFVGCIKRVMMTNAENLLQRASLIKSKGTKSGCLNECRVRNPCLNQGTCINRFSKAKCDCTGTGFEGKRCEKEILRLRLSSKDYLVYDMSSRPQATFRDHINVHFKTSKKNGLLLQTSFNQDYVTIKLTNGRIVVEWNLGSGKLVLALGSNLHNNQWHMIDVRRFKRNVKAILNGVYIRESICPPSHSTFNMDGGEGKIFVGGTRTTSRRNRFDGCLRKVVFGDVEFISKLKENDSSFSVKGNTIWSCGVPTTVPLTTVPMTTRTTRADNRKRQRSGRNRVLTNAGEVSNEKPSVIKLRGSSVPRTANPKVKSTERMPRPTTCSPNDVRCALRPHTKRTADKSTKKPSRSTGDSIPTKRVESTSPDLSTRNASSHTGNPEQEGFQELSNELGNVPTAIGLVLGSIVLFLLCGLISYKFSKHRNEKQRKVHEIKIEVRDVDDEEKNDANGFHQDVPVTN